MHPYILPLKLKEKDNELFNKIINGERLSGHEKAKPMFKLLHNFWSQIKDEKLQAAKIFTKSLDIDEVSE